MVKMSEQPRIALIAGIGGQDGSYMAELLLSKGYKVYGLTRSIDLLPSLNLAHLAGQVTLLYTNYQLHQLVEIISTVKPDEIYNLTGQSYVSKSWELVQETIDSQGVIVSRFLEAIFLTDRSIKFLQSSSAEIFNSDLGSTFNESSSLGPYNPYGCAKLMAHSMVDAYRKSKGMFAVNAILFPHESPRRHQNFAVKKIIHTAVKIKNSQASNLQLGNLEVQRDWGYAPNYVNAMYLMMQADNPRNYCLSTGNTHSLLDIVKTTFSSLDLDWEQ